MKRLSLILLAAFGISLAVAPVQKEKEIEPTFFLASALSPYDEPKYLKNGAYYSDKGTFTQKETTYDRMGLGTTWDSVRGNKVKVAVIDTGLKSSHQDFNGTNISTHSYNVYGSNANYEDVNASIHGSVSASCIAAAINGVGGVGIAPDAELYIYRTCDANSGFTGTYLKKALRRAIDDHVDVINMSIQGYTETFTETYVEDWDGLTYTVNGSNNGLYKNTLQDLITEAYNAGITVVAAAGNFNTDRTCFPAANDYVIGVGSTGLNDNDAKAGYSNYGSYVDVCAPGYVVAPHPQSDSSYCVTYGTSFSAPLVSGAIALYKSKYPSATPAQIEARLKATCDPLNYTGSGSGRVNVANFLNNGPAETWIDASGMELPASADVAVESSVKVTPTFTPSNTTRQTCYWSSSDETIATVDCYGNVTGKKQGSVTITATSIDGGFVDTCTVNVGDYISVESVEFSESGVSLYEGKTKQLSWTLTPSNPTNPDVTFSSNNTSVATVDSNGLLTGVAPGNATITINAVDGKSDTCAVTVNETPKQTLVIKRNSFSNSGGYAWYDWSQNTSEGNNVSGKGELYTTTTASMQFNKSNGNKVAALFNTTAIPGSITKISAKTASGTNRSWYAYVTSTSCSASGSTLTFGNNKTQVGTAKTISSTQTDFGTTNAGYGFFCIQEGETGASCIDNFTITYIPKEISSISVKTAPGKLSYESGETFDPTGLVITATYSDDTTTDISYANSSSGFSFTPSTSTALKTTDTSVTISYGGKTCTQAITVTAAKTLSSISISGQTTAFIEGDTFTFGGIVTAHYSDGDSGDVTASATFTGYNMTTVGNQTVTVSYTYKGKTETATYSINVGAGTLSLIAVSGQTTVYQKNATFSFDGTCTATFENGYQRVVTPTNVTSPNMSVSGVKVITVSYTYNGKTVSTTYNITVNAYRDVYESVETSIYCTYDFTKLSDGSNIAKDVIQTSYLSTGGITGATVTSCSNVYVSGKLLRLGTGNNAGNVVFNFGTTKITNLTIVAKGWSSSESNCKMSITNGGSITTTSETTLQTFNVSLTTSTSSITLSTSKSNRIQIQRVVFYNTSSTMTNIGQSDDCMGLETFITNCMHMDYTDNLGYCKDAEHHYYETAKAAFNALNDHQRSLFIGNEAYSLEWERLSTWASINGDYLDSNNKLVNTANVINAINNTVSNEVVLVMLIISILLIPLGLYFFKRKEQ